MGQSQCFQPGAYAYHLHSFAPWFQRASDAQILEFKRVEDRVVLTFDLDFGDLLALGLNDKPSTIIFRLDDETADSVNTSLLTVLAQTERDLQEGALILVQDFRYRIRRLPIS